MKRTIIALFGFILLVGYVSAVGESDGDKADSAYKKAKIKNRAKVQSKRGVGDIGGKKYVYMDEDDLDADEACAGLAACEVVARLKGHWGVRNPYTETVDTWVARHPIAPTPEVIGLAAVAIQRVLGEPSELRELWEEEDAKEWLAAVENLRSRVTD